MIKSKILVTNISFALTASILAILLGLRSNFAAFYMGGWAGYPEKHFEGLIVTLAFLGAWLFYGKAKGFKKDKGFLKFNSLYWGIGGVICLFPYSYFISPIGKFAFIYIPIYMTIFVPTFALTYFYRYSSDTLYLVSIVSLITSWSAGAIGYFLGCFLEKAKK